MSELTDEIMEILREAGMDRGLMKEIANIIEQWEEDVQRELTEARLADEEAERVAREVPPTQVDELPF